MLENFLAVVEDPLKNRCEGFSDGPAHISDGILRPGHRLSMENALNQPVSLELAKGDREHAAGNARNGVEKFGEPPRSLGQDDDRHDAPLVPNPLKNTVDEFAIARLHA
jgi:hypothetical protein